MITIISDDQGQDIGRRLHEAARAAGVPCAYFRADTMNVKPCMGCGSCGGKTFGRCVQRDDMEALLQSMVGGGGYVIVSPIRFGSFSAAAKQVQDRTCVLGDPHYRVRQGELVKGSRGDSRPFFAVGVAGPGCDAQEQEAFRRLHAENLRIMDSAGRTFVLEENCPQAQVDAVVEAMRHG